MIRSRVEYLLITLSDISYSSYIYIYIYISEKGIIRRFIYMKGKVSLYYYRNTIELQSGYNRLHHLLHLGSTQYKQFLNTQKKKKDDKGERQNKKKKKKKKGKRDGDK